MQKLAVILVLLLTLGSFSSAKAQTSASQLQRAQDLLEEEKAIRLKIEEPQKKYIKSIKVEGATLLNQDKIQELTAPFFRHWLTQEDINIILNSIKQAYKQEGYPNQPIEIRYELKGKVLWIKIKE